MDYDLEGFRRFFFTENESSMVKTVTEGIGAFKTFTVKPLSSGPPIKRTPSIKRTLSRVPK